MTGIKIDLSADTGGLKSAMQEIKQQAAGLRDALAGAELKIDSGDAIARLESARKAATALNQAIAQQRKLNIDTTDADAALSGAKSAIADVTKALYQSPSGKTSQAENTLKQIAAQAQRTKEALKGMLGRDVTDAQAQALNTAFERFKHSGGAQASYAKPFGNFSDWSSGHSSQFSTASESAQHRKATLERLMRNAGIEGGGQPGNKPGFQFSGQRMGSIAGAVGGAMGAMMSGGGDGGVMSSIGRAGGGVIGTGLGMMAGTMLGGPIGSMIGMLAGSFLGSAGGGIGGALDAGQSRAQNEAIDVSDLRHSLGALDTDFEMLRGSIRAAADGMGVTYTEATKLAKNFAHISGNSNGKSLGEEVRDAIGFGRGLGIDPSQSNSFFATQRQFKTTNSPEDARRMGMIMGEAMAKGGTFSKADEVLQAVTNFTATAARAGLSAPNVEGYASMMGSMTGKGIPGLDVMGSAGLMNKMDAGVRGNQSEAARNFMLGAYQDEFGKGFSATDLDYATSQGAYGGPGSAFSKNSPVYQAASPEKQREYDKYNKSKRSNLEIFSGKIEKEYGNNPDLMNHAYAGLFGISPTEAAAARVSLQSVGGGSGLNDRMKSLGIDMSRNKDMSNVPLLAQIASTKDAGSLSEYADKFKAGGMFKKELSKVEKDDISRAQSSGDQEGLRNALLKVAGNREMVTDEGDKTRKSISGVENVITRMAGALLPLANGIRDGIDALVQKLAPDSDYVKNKKAAAIQAEKERSNVLPQIEGYDKAIAMHDSTANDESKPMAERQQARKYADQMRVQRQGVLDKARAAQEANPSADSDYASKLGNVQDSSSQGLLPGGRTNPGSMLSGSSGKKLSPEQESALLAQDKNLGHPAGTAKAQMLVESGGKADAVSKAGARGYFQIMPKTQSALEKRLGRKLDPTNFDDALLMRGEVMRENQAKFGNLPDALRAYNGGWNPNTWGNKETSGYAQKVSALTDQIPQEQRMASSKPESMQASFDHKITIVDEKGNLRAKPIISTSVFSPQLGKA